MPTTLEPLPTGRTAPPPPAPAPGLSPVEAQAIDAAVEQGWAIGTFVVRLLGYAALYAIANRTDFGPHLLSGVLVGDLVSWGVLLLRRWREIGRHTLLELGAFVGLGLWLGGRVQFPAEPEFRAVMVLAMFGMFAVKLLGLRRDQD